MPFHVRMSKALAKAQAELRGLKEEVAQQMMTQAANAGIEKARDKTIELTVAKFNVSAKTMQAFVTPKRAGTGETGGHVDLHVRALPSSAFDPRVRMVPVPVRIFGRRAPVTLSLPAIEFKRYRNGGWKLLYPFFAAHTRATGVLPAGDKILRRVGSTRSGRGERSDGSFGNKLTVPRFYTFPKRFLAEILPKVQAAAGSEMAVTFRAAYRKKINGLKVLRSNR